MVYAANIKNICSKYGLECLRDVMGNGIWPKDVNYNLITIINDIGVETYYYSITLEKTRLIKTAREEKKMVRWLIETNVHKYTNIIEGAGEIDIYALDQTFADIDKTIGYIRKIIIMIPSIVEKKMKIHMIKEYEKKNKRISLKREKKQKQEQEMEEFLRLMNKKNTNKYQDLGWLSILKVTTQIPELCHKTSERISTAKISEWQHKYYNCVTKLWRE